MCPPTSFAKVQMHARRGVFLLPTFAPGTVKTVLTISSPHSMPAYADAWLGSHLDEVNRFWRQGTMSTKMVC